MIKKGDRDFILGEPFFVNYYTIFDGAENRIGLALSNTNQIPSDQPKSDLPLPLWAIITIVVVGVVVIGGVIVFLVKRRSKPDDEARAIYK